MENNINTEKKVEIIYVATVFQHRGIKELAELVGQVTVTTNSIAVYKSAAGLAWNAIICQGNVMFPIVGLEIFVDGSHDIKKSADVPELILAAFYKALNDQKVLPEGTLLKPNTVTPGFDLHPSWLPRTISVPCNVMANDGQLLATGKCNRCHWSECITSFGIYGSFVGTFKAMYEKCHLEDKVIFEGTVLLGTMDTAS